MSNLHYHFLEIKIRCFYVTFSTIVTFLICYNFQVELIYLIGKPFLKFQQTFIFLELTEAFYTLLHISSFLTLLVSFPFVFYHLWGFFVPSFYDFERIKINYWCIFFISLLFCEILITYFFLLPQICSFLLSFEISSGIDKSGLHLIPLLNVEFTVRIKSYIDLVVRILSTVLFFFQIPLCIFILYSKKVFHVSHFYMNRKWLYLFSLLLSGLIVPPDVVSQIFLSFVFYLVFEILIFLGLFFD